MTPEQVLRLLRDVPGVAGSCLLDGHARVLLRDLPTEVGDELVAGVGQRAQAALAAASDAQPEVAGMVLRFSRLSVFCSSAGRNTLLLMAAPAASTTAIKAAIRASNPALARVVERVLVSQPKATPERRRKRGDGIWG